MSAEALEVIGEDIQVMEIAHGAVGAIVKSEVEAQLDAAHKYPRSVKKFLVEAITLATFDKEVAMSCMYAMPRGGKVISGPSIRLAEICASAYGNLHMGARVVGIEDKEVIAQGITWDLEKNNRVTIETRRRITDSKGRRYNDDMITMTGNAAASIGLRNSIFRVIPKAYVNAVYQKAREVAVGNAFTLVETRAKVIERLTKTGVLVERILARIERPSVEDITIDDVEILIGIGTAIKNGDTTVDEAFPAATAPTKGTVDLEALKPAKEDNRGHGNEKLEQFKKPESAAATTQPSQPGQGGPEPGNSKIAPAPAAETKPAAATSSVDPEAKCTAEQFDLLQAIGNDNDVAPKVFISWVKEVLKYKMVAHLKQKDFERAKKFLENGGKE